MRSVLELARPEIRNLQAYEHAAWEPSLERLHANESPWRTIGDDSQAGLNRYPEPQPRALIERLAAVYDVPVQRVLVGRGSDEAIDLLTRAFCRAGVDEVVICPPTFGMYAVAACIQGAGVVAVPLRRDHDYAVNVDAVIAAVSPRSRLIYLCSPNNPTGNSLPREAILRIAAAASGRALVVVDEAYLEFAGTQSIASHIDALPHLAVLRTLSKAHGLAGARIGALLAHDDVVTMLRAVIPPYALPQLAIEAGLRSLAPARIAIQRERVALLRAERGRLAAALAARADVRRVWPSDANFLLVEFEDVNEAVRRTRAAGLLVRDVRSVAGLEHALRITVGSPEQNDRLIGCLA